MKPQNLVVVIELLDMLQVPDLFVKEVLERLDPTVRALFARAGNVACRALLVASGLPRAGALGWGGAS